MDNTLHKRNIVMPLIIIASTWLVVIWLFYQGYQIYLNLYDSMEEYTIFRECVFTETNVLYLLHILISVFLVNGFIFKIRGSGNKIDSSKKLDIFILIINIAFITFMILSVNKIFKLYFVEIISTLFTQFILVSICEEYVFRVAVSKILNRNKIDKWKKILISGIFFALMHLLAQFHILEQINHWAILKLILVPLILGGALAMLYEFTGDILLLVMIHGTYNVLACLSVGIYKNIFCILYILIILFLCIYTVVKRVYYPDG